MGIKQTPEIPQADFSPWVLEGSAIDGSFGNQSTESSGGFSSCSSLSHQQLPLLPTQIFTGKFIENCSYQHIHTKFCTKHIQVYCWLHDFWGAGWFLDIVHTAPQLAQRLKLLCQRQFPTSLSSYKIQNCELGYHFYYKHINTLFFISLLFNTGLADRQLLTLPEGLQVLHCTASWECRTSGGVCVCEIKHSKKKDFNHENFYNH